MTAEEIKQAKRQRRVERELMMSDTSFMDFADSFNNGAIDLSVHMEISLDFAPPLDIREKTEKEKRREHWKNVKLQWLATTYERYGEHPMICHLCGNPIKPGDTISPDHIIPRSDGGLDEPENLHESHDECNKRRNRNSLKFSKYYSAKLMAHIEKSSYMDEDKMRWNIVVVYPDKKPIAEVLIKTRTITGRVWSSKTTYNTNGRIIKRETKFRTKEPYYNLNGRQR